MSNIEFQLQVFLESLHGLAPQSMTLEQLARALSAVRFAAPRWQDEYARRQAAIERRKEMGEAA